MTNDGGPPIAPRPPRAMRWVPQRAVKEHQGKPIPDWTFAIGIWSLAWTFRERLRQQSRLRDFSVAKTRDNVIVHHADCLHEGIADGRADERESPSRQILAQRIGFGRSARDLPRRSPGVPLRAAADEPPHIDVEAPELPLDRQEGLGVLTGSGTRTVHGHRGAGHPTRDRDTRPTARSWPRRSAGSSPRVWAWLARMARPFTLSFTRRPASGASAGGRSPHAPHPRRP